MKLRSAISLELARQGLVNGSPEFIRSYNRKLRQKNIEKARNNWKRYYKKKNLETKGEWGRSRLKKWKLANPSKWNVIAQKASKNGIHRRFYAKNR